MLDDFKGASEDATRCLERNPYFLAAYQLRGAAWQNLEEFELAATDYKTSLEYYPEDRITLVNMGIVNIELKQYEVAEKFFEYLLRRYPDYTPGYLARSHMYLQMEDTTRAMADLDTAIVNDRYTAQADVYKRQIEHHAPGSLQELALLLPAREVHHLPVVHLAA